MLRKFFCVLSSCLILLFFASCQSKNTLNQSLHSEDLAFRLADAFPLEHGYASYDLTATALYFPESTTCLQEITVLYSVRPDDYTEIGVFTLQNADERAVITREISAYLQELRETYAPQAVLYDPSQADKLSAASFKVIGSYVIYTVMTETEQQLFWKTAQALLK